MMLQLIRHATIKCKMNNQIFLVDPMLSPKGEMAPVGNAANEYRNPLVNLPFPAENVLEDVDAILLTHSHRDHFDEKAVEMIPKDIPIFCQTEDSDKLISFAFSNVISIGDHGKWQGIQIVRTGGQHGTGDLGKQMGPVSGFILKAENEPTIYIAGDTIWCMEMEEAIAEHTPDIILVNGGEAQFLTGDPITMGPRDMSQVSERAPFATILVTHMEAWNHCLLSRQELQQYILQNKLSNVKVLEDGEIFKY